MADDDAYDCLLSDNRMDTATALALAGRLRAAGLSVCNDPKRLGPWTPRPAELA